MQVNATYKNGRLVLPRDIELVKDNFTVILNFPAEAVRRKTAEPTGKGFSVRREIEAIVGPRDSREPQARVDCKNEWHEHLEEKYLGK